MNSLERYPDVSAGRELLNVSRAVFSDPLQIIRIDNMYPESPFAWHSPDTFLPHLKIIAPGLQRARRGGIHLETAIMIFIEDGTDYELKVDEKDDDIQDDPFVLEFVDAFRQYKPHPLALSFHEREAAIKLLGREI